MNINKGEIWFIGPEKRVNRSYILTEIRYYVNKHKKPIARFIMNLKGETYASIFNKHRK
jgi:hypothetical protein